MENLLFKELNLSTQVQKALTKMGFEEATPIQANSIPHILNGKDVVGQAQTGTGKTCAFGIPAVEAVDTKLKAPQILVLCPTRELAIQMAEEIQNVSKYKEGVKILPIYGGQQIDRQIFALKKKPQIIIGTPGRLMDHMRRKTIKLNYLKMIVLDEADEMLNMGFREDIDTILEKVPAERQTLLFSATIPKSIMDITKRYQTEPVHIKTVHKELTVPNIEQFYIETTKKQKVELLSRLIEVNDVKLSVVFCNTKKGVDQLVDDLNLRGYNVAGLHGDMKQQSRDRVMSKFRNRSIEILVATDVAARGIDVDNIDTVFNYDIPNDEEYYVHRIGRTGRTGRKGTSYTFVCGREIYKLKDIQRYTKSKIALQKPPSLDSLEEKKIANVIKDLKKVLESKDYTKFIPQIEKLIENEDLTSLTDNNYLTSLDLNAAFLKLVLNETSNSLPVNLEVSSNNKFTSNGGNTARLFINVGLKDGLTIRTLVQQISDATKVSRDDVTRVKVLNTFSFVEVPSEDADKIIDIMNKIKIKGRKVRVEKANKAK
jgi:ATP-dependent RNA helicase DeaD